MSSRPRFALSFLGFLLVWGASTGADDKASPEPGWIKDTKGCKIANPNPKPNETVAWSGPCPNGVAEGMGVLQFSMDGKAGSRYEGEVKQGVISGRGKLSTPDGAIYDGDWVDGKPDGYGKYNAPDGSSFVGGWTAGKQDGPGTYRDVTGAVLTGDWKNGKFVDPKQQ